VALHRQRHRQRHDGSAPLRSQRRWRPRSQGLFHALGESGLMAWFVDPGHAQAGPDRRVLDFGARQPRCQVLPTGQSPWFARRWAVPAASVCHSTLLAAPGAPCQRLKDRATSVASSRAFGLQRGGGGGGLLTVNPTSTPAPQPDGFNNNYIDNWREPAQLLRSAK
jgi:hypothetical protein